MAEGAQRHAGLIKTLGGALVIAAGIVPILVNYPYLSSSAGEDRTMAWAAAGCGAAGVLMGLWILLTHRVLLGGLGVTTFSLPMAGMCLTLALLNWAETKNPTPWTGSTPDEQSAHEL